MQKCSLNLSVVQDLSVVYVCLTRRNLELLWKTALKVPRKKPGRYVSWVRYWAPGSLFNFYTDIDHETFWMMRKSYYLKFQPVRTAATEP